MLYSTILILHTTSHYFTSLVLIWFTTLHHLTFLIPPLPPYYLTPLPCTSLALRCFTRLHTEKTPLWDHPCMLSTWTSWPLKISWYSDNKTTTLTTSQVSFSFGRVIIFVLVSLLVTLTAVTWSFYSNSFFLFLLCNSSCLQSMIVSTSSPDIHWLNFIII